MTSTTMVMDEVVRAGAREAIRRLQVAHEDYPGFDRDGAGDALIDYDADGDVLYLHIVPPQPTEAEETPEGTSSATRLAPRRSFA